MKKIRKEVKLIILIVITVIATVITALIPTNGDGDKREVKAEETQEEFGLSQNEMESLQAEWLEQHEYRNY